MLRMNKKFALLLVLAMLASMFVGMGTASAYTNNSALFIPNVAISSSTTDGKTLGTIQLAETTAGSVGAAGFPIQVIVTLPAGSSYRTAPTDANIASYIDLPAAVGVEQNALVAGNVVIQDALCAANKLVFNIVANPNPTRKAFINLKYDAAGLSQVVIQAGAADYKVNIWEASNAIASGDVINAHVVNGGTTALALATPTVTQGANKGLGTLRITENIASALSAGTDSFWVTLPRGFEFIPVNNAAPTTNSTISTLGGFGADAVTAGTGPSFDITGNTKYFFNVASQSTATPGVIDMSFRVNITNEALKGDIIATIGGTNTGISPATVVLGKYGEFGVSAECADPTNIYAGRVQAKIGAIVMKENVAATLITQRTVTLTLPEGAKWETAADGTAINYPMPVVTKGYMTFAAGAPIVLDNGRTLSYTVNAQSATVPSTVEFKQGYVDIALDCAPGDLAVEFGGTAGAVADDGSKVSVKVATIVAPVTLTGEKPTPTVVIGKQIQDGCNFTITEAGVGAVMAKLTQAVQGYTSTTVAVAGPGGGSVDVTSLVPTTTYSPITTSLLVKCPDGVAFAAIPEVSVTGDLKLYSTGVKLSPSGNELIIPISSSSITTASTIEVKNAKFTIDRTVPQGDIKLQVMGSAVDAYAIYHSSNIFDELSFYTVASEDVVANVTTPAPGEQNAVASFVIGQSKFTLDGAEKDMDVAPYIKDGRTFLPLAYVAQALGVSSNNILWDATNQTVTLIKGDKVLQVKIASKTMLLNGAAITLDAAPEINSGRTCLPIALLAQAFGESASWDAATQTVNIQ